VLPVQTRGVATTTGLPSRIRLAMRLRANWLQLARYGIVGALGYVISIGSFAVLHHAGVGSSLAATGAFCLALTNNFFWNRHWTFQARDGHAGFQATRFLAIHLGAFLYSLVVLRALIDIVGVAPVTAQAIAVLAAAPPNFIGHRIWSFRV